MFKNKLNDAMQSLNITQAQLAKMTGYSKSSISQYCSGQNVPSEKRLTELADILGLDEEYFREGEVAALRRSPRIPTLTPQEAGELLGISKDTVRAGLRDGVFPWGYAIRGSGSKWIYFINAKRFAEIEGITI